MSPALRRPFFVVALVAVVVAGWIALAPGSAAPTEPVADVATGAPSLPAAGRSAAGSAGAVPTASGDAPAGPPSEPAPASPSPSSPPAEPEAIPPSATAALTAALDARLERLRTTKGIPGISVSIIFADGSAWHGASGLADVASGRPVTTDTAFSIASVSKTFTAALILGLVADGRLRLDSTAKTYLPGVAIDPTITVRQLLDHTSGLRDFYFGPRIDKALLSKPGRTWDAKRALGYVGKPYAKPGVAWHYSNTNYLLLGLVAEAVGQAPVATQLHDRFFAPLGLDHTWYQAVDAPLGPLATGYRFTGADPHLPAVSLADGSAVAPFTSVVTASGAAGSVAGTADDLARWAAALYGGHALDDGSRATMVGDLVHAGTGSAAITYGLGVQVVEIGGRLTYGHSGRFLGARAAMRWLPGERVAIAVTTNQSRTDPNVIVADLLRIVFPPPPPAVPTPIPTSSACPTCTVVR